MATPVGFGAGAGVQEPSGKQAAGGSQAALVQTVSRTFGTARGMTVEESKSTTGTTYVTRAVAAFSGLGGGSRGVARHCQAGGMLGSTAVCSDDPLPAGASQGSKPRTSQLSLAGSKDEQPKAPIPIRNAMQAANRVADEAV